MFHLVSFATTTTRSIVLSHTCFTYTQNTLPTLRQLARTMVTTPSSGQERLDLMSEIVVDHNNVS